MIPQSTASLMRSVHFVVGLLTGTFSCFWFASEIRNFNGASTPIWQQVLGTTLVVGGYFGISAIAIRHVRASSLIAICVALLSSPVYLIMYLASGWSPQSVELAKPLIWYLAANGVLLVSGIVGFVSAPLRKLPSTRSQ